LSLVRDGPGRPRTTEGFALSRFLRTRGFNFWAVFIEGSGGGGGQRVSAVRGSTLMAGCGVAGNGGLILGAGAGFEIIVDWIGTMGLGEGTITIFGCWAEQRLSTTRATRVMISTSSSDIATKLRRVVDCCRMSSSRCC